MVVAWIHDVQPDKASNGNLFGARTASNLGQVSLENQNLIANQRSNPVSRNGVPFYERAMRDEILRWEKPLKGDWANRRFDFGRDLAESHQRARCRRSILPLAFTA